MERNISAGAQRGREVRKDECGREEGNGEKLGKRLEFGLEFVLEFDYCSSSSYDNSDYYYHIIA